MASDLGVLRDDATTDEEVQSHLYLRCVVTMPRNAVLTRSRTQGGIFTTPGDAYTTPVDMWVKALGRHIFRGTKPTPMLMKIKFLFFDRDRISLRCLSHFLSLLSLQIFFWRKLAEIMKSQGSNQLAVPLR